MENKPTSKEALAFFTQLVSEIPEEYRSIYTDMIIKYSREYVYATIKIVYDGITNYNNKPFHKFSIFKAKVGKDFEELEPCYFFYTKEKEKILELLKYKLSIYDCMFDFKFENIINYEEFTKP